MTEIDWTLALRADGSPGAILAYADWLEDGGAPADTITGVRQLSGFVEWVQEVIRDERHSRYRRGRIFTQFVIMGDEFVHFRSEDSDDEGEDLPQYWKPTARLLHSDTPAVAWLLHSAGFRCIRRHLRPDGEQWTFFGQNGR